MTGGTNPGTGQPPIIEFELREAGHGFGRLLPHAVLRPGTAEIIPIRRITDIAENVFRGNGVLPAPSLPEEAIAPDGSPANHFMFAQFGLDVDPLDVISPSATGNGLDGGLTVTALNPITGASFAVPGRAFVGGQTVVLENGQPVVQAWATYDSATGLLVPNPSIPEARGLPGVEAVIPNAEALVSPSTVLFVADSDSDLTSFDTFPSGVTIRLRATSALLSASGVQLRHQVLASTTVGQDLVTPELLFSPPPVNAPLISPGNGDVDVDPETSIRFEFSESVQPFSIGEIEGQGPPLLSSAIRITFGPLNAQTSVPINARPVSPYDLSVYEVTPGFAFPGSGPDPQSCGIFSNVDVTLSPAQVEDLSSRPDPTLPGQATTANFNALGAQTFFETAEGTGLVNAPVAPDAIFVARGGNDLGLSVVDLNGFGKSTGNPIWSTPYPLEGETRFPFDPNVFLNPAARPLLTPGTCTIDGGSAGVFTLTLDSQLGDLVATSPTLAGVSDMQIAHALDNVFSNGPPPFGCQAGGGDICALDGLKVISFTVPPIQPNTIQPDASTSCVVLAPGYENLISWSPHPNPPGILFPPMCVSPFISSSEPTSVDVIASGNGTNLLVTGNPFPHPPSETPPTGLLVLEQNQFFAGASFGQTSPDNCLPHQIRQQVGHFLYVADRARNEVVVFNSNRCVVIDRLPVPDPVSISVGPNLDLLAVSSQLADIVTFIDIDPASTQFHQVIRNVDVGNSPRGLAFEPTNEDVVVCNEASGTLSIISVASLAVRKTVSARVDQPFGLAVTPRMSTFSFDRGVYFAYVLGRAGECSVFESGPNGANGWGFDDVLGVLPIQFQAPKAIQIDPLQLDASVFIAHEGAIDPATGAAGSLGDGALSRLYLSSAATGTVPLGASAGTAPNFRDLVFSVSLSLSAANGQLSGIPVDIAFDNQRNLGGTQGPSNSFSAGSPLPANNKATVRIQTQLGGSPRNTSTPSYLLAAVPDSAGVTDGVIDVLHLDALGLPLFDVNPYEARVQSIAVPHVRLLCDYFQQ